MNSHTSVYNKGMETGLFNELCDSLSSLRHWCHDYRLVRNFNPIKEKPYWCSYPRNDQMLIDAEYESVKEDVEVFCGKHGLIFDDVIEVKIVKEEARPE